MFDTALEIKGRLPMHLEIQGSWAPVIPAGAVPPTSANHRDFRLVPHPPGLLLHQGIHSACYAAELCGCPHIALGLSSNVTYTKTQSPRVPPTQISTLHYLSWYSPLFFWSSPWPDFRFADNFSIGLHLSPWDNEIHKLRAMSLESLLYPSLLVQYLS